MTDSGVQEDGRSDGTSTSLLLRVQALDPRAWERMVSLYCPLVYHWCRRAGLQPSDAADVGQEVFRAVARKVGDFRRDAGGGSFRGWLRTITANKIRDHARRAARCPPAEGGSDARDRLAQTPSVEPAEGAGDAAAETGLVYRRALELVRAEFEERTFQAFWRSAVDGERAAAVAADLGLSANAVYLAKSRVLRRVREEFAGLLDD